MKLLKLLILLIASHIAFAAETSGLADQVYDLMNYDGYAADMYERLPIAEATGKDNRELAAGFRKHVIESMSANFSDAELSEVVELLRNGQEVPERFSNWILNELHTNLLWFYPNTNGRAAIMYDPANIDRQ